ncbi:probable disease resistance protein RF9 isoform X2 [Quercus robur]|uniref:probable disease resistance protein RF9 isoform X2 n=1 Tax=Quercus robur TaxID=38942 RepID=UPI0021633F3F|nr:probable disease resistance protein RF9 isoform X2 [Quercus robur]
MDGVGAAVVPAMDAVEKLFGEHTELELRNSALGGGWNNHQYDQERHSALVGLEDTEKELVARLLDDNEKSLRVISLVSEEPLGKTALARKVYNRLDIRQHFECRAWVRVPKDLAYKDVTYRGLLLIILEQIPRPQFTYLELKSEEELSAMIYQSLMKVRFLIVLDDVWTDGVRFMLAYPFANVLNGSRIILTTRDCNVAWHDDLWNSHLNLVRLSDEGSWALFLKKVGRPQNSSDINNFREDILRICHGLSPAIMLLGGVLSTMESSEWSRVIDLVVAAHFGKGQLPLSNFVVLSYQMLPYVVKPCFLYLAVFPKAYEISIRRLLLLWLAHGFVQTSPEASVPEDVAKKYLEELVCRNMIEIVRWKPDGTPKTCHMPCYLYDVFLPKAKDIGFLDLHHGESECTSADSLEFRPPFVSFNTRKRDRNNWRRTFKEIINRGGFLMLKVLDLEGIFKPVLSKKLGIMVNLRYLNLRWTKLNLIPALIGDLPRLEILDLKYTNITILPCSIWKANNLRYLYMNNVTIQKPSNQPPTNLEVLTGLRIGSKDPGIYGLDRCTSLRKLVLRCHSESALKTAECISRLGNLHTLKLRSMDPFGQPSNLVLSPLEDHPSLSKISLLGVIKDHRIGKLPQLRVLNLFASSYLGQEMTCHADQNFPELRVLKLWYLEKLELLTVENGAMPQLRELEIRSCEKLRSSEGLDQLPALKELILTYMPQDFVEDARKRLGNNYMHVIHGNIAHEVWDRLQSLEGKTVKS